MQRSISHYILPFFALALVGLSACEIETDIKLKDETPRVVIEGWVTDAPGPYGFRINHSTAYLGSSSETPISGAVAVLRDDMGTVDTLEEIRPGWYESGHLQGQQLHTYTLDVTVSGQQYTATNYLPRVTPLLGIGYSYNDTMVFGAGYYVGAVAQEPAGLGDFYQFRLYRNDSLFDSAFDILVTDDRLVDGQTAPFLFPYPHELGDTVVVEVRGISNLSYDYYITLLQRASSGSGPFGSPPENLITNITNGGLGFFGAAAVTRDTVVIQ